VGHGGSALLFPITCLVSFITKWHLSVGRPWSVLRSTGTLAWPRGTGPFFPASGPLAHWPGSLALMLIGSLALAWPHLPGLICSLPHRLLGAGLICSLAPWRWPPWLICSWLIGPLAQASFLAFLELFCSGLRLLGSLALIAPFAHLLIGSFGPLWLLCSMAYWLIGSFVPFLAFIELIWLRPHFWHFSIFFALASGSLAPRRSLPHLLMCSFAHIGLLGSSAQWLICSSAHLCLFWHSSSSFGSGLIFGISRAFLLRPQDIRVSGLFNLKLHGSLGSLVKRSFLIRLFNSSTLAFYSYRHLFRV